MFVVARTKTLRVVVVHNVRLSLVCAMREFCGEKVDWVFKRLFLNFEIFLQFKDSIHIGEKPRLGTKKRKLTAIGDKIPILTTE